MSSAQIWRPEVLTEAVGRSARSAVWRLTAAFALPLMIGAVVLLVGALTLVVRTDHDVVERAVQRDAKVVWSKVNVRSSKITLAEAVAILVKGRVQRLEEARNKGLDPATFYRLEPAADQPVSHKGVNRTLNLHRPNIPAAETDDTEVPADQPIGGEWAKLTPMGHPWWLLGNAPSCVGEPGSKLDGGWWVIKEADAPNGPDWGLACRMNMEGGGVVYVGQRFALSEMQSEMIGLAWWTLGAAWITALVLGFLVSRAMLKRVEAVNQVCDRVRQGELAARATGENAGDEFGALARHVNTMLEQINGLVLGLRDVSNRIAHDLRTPIARLKTDLEGAARAETLEAARSGAEAAAAETDEILATFQALLDIAEVESGVDGGLQPMKLDDAARSAADLYEAVAEDAGVKLVTDLAPAPLLGEPQLLVRLIANLVDNAIKFSPPGGEIRLTTARDESDVILTVADQGPGVAPEDRETVMRRFVRGRDSAATPGHGLGLALVAAVAKRHGAKISLGDAEPGLKVRVAFRAF